MKVIFLGSSEFAVRSLAEINKQHYVMAVITQPDRRKGRHLTLSETPVKIYAEKNKIPVFSPLKVADKEFIARLKDFNADLFIVVSFGQILSREILAIPRRYCINLHASILPRWRGAAPINYALVNQDRQTGVTIIRMNEFLDRGDILLSRNISIEDEDDAVSLADKLSILGAKALLDAIDIIEDDTVQFIAQDEKFVTVAQKLKKEDGLINWQDTAEYIHGKVRGLLPWPCAHTYYKGKFLKILKTKVVCMNLDNSDKISFGEIVAVEKKKGIIVATGKDYLLIEILQIEGKKAICADDFVMGQHLKAGEKFSLQGNHR